MDELMGGQATAAPETKTAQENTPTQTEQAASTQSQASEESFTDFNQLPDDVRAQLEPYYKQMQGDYTRKTQKLSKSQKEHLQKVQAYDQFMSNPLDNIMRMGAQYGLQFTPAGQQQPQQQEQKPAVSQDWQPQTWEEVFSKSSEFLQPQLQQVIKEAIFPYQQEIESLKAELGQQKAGRIEKQFDSIDPNWRQYEDEMRELLTEHPSLAKDPAKLYRLAVPDEVVRSRAAQEALKSLEAKTQAAKLETSGRSKPSGPARNGPMTFDEAFQAAKNSLRSK